MSSRLPLVGAIALLVAIGGYFWSSSRPAKKVVQPPPTAEPGAPAAEIPTPGAPRRVAPSAPAAAPDAAPAGTTVTIREDGTQVHDKRGQFSPHKSPIARPTVKLLFDAAEPLVKKCGEPLAARGQKTRLQATVSLKAENGQVGVQKTVVLLESLDDPELVSCIEKALGSLRVPAPAEQADMEYRLSLPYTVP